MEHKPVTSSNLASIGYDPTARAMEVTFKNGARHRYTGVSPEAHEAFASADSVGSYFHKHVRGKYDSEPVPMPKEHAQ